MAEAPTGIHCVVPSRLGVGEPFVLAVRLLGPVREVPSTGTWKVPKPGLESPFNRNVKRRIQFVDNTLPAWEGELRVSAAGLDGPAVIRFDGREQGVYRTDTRPVRRFAGFRFTEPGFHFVRLLDPASGVEASSNAVYVSAEPPAERLYWGDPHWQTFFSDGIRCPEELYAFARDEGFLDFGAISDHMEGVTDRQWEYFQAVTNDWNQPGRFATLIGQEWTHHLPEGGAPGHRNVYVRGDHAPPLRCTDPACNSLQGLWARLDAAGLEAVAIPHHSANRQMGVDWEQGWHPAYEAAVEIYSVWGSSEKSAAAGNPRPIHPQTCRGEMPGRHVIDALRRGYRFGFVGGGDVHDGRPGEALHQHSYPEGHHPWPQGLTAAFAPRLERGAIFDAIRRRRTVATTCRRIYLEVASAGSPAAPALRIRAASDDGLARLLLVRADGEAAAALAGPDSRVMEGTVPTAPLGPDDFVYVRAETESGDLAWASPLWADAWEAPA
jgi:hypothetical protein